MTHQPEAGAGGYFASISHLLETVMSDEREAIMNAASAVADCFAADGLLFIFGSGHSHMFAEEAFFRAGGSTRICPILKPAFMLHEGARRSTTLERESGHAEDILSGYSIDPDRDLLLVVSNSGKNAVPVEVAQLARDRGITTLAITSKRYSAQAQQGVATLAEVADIVIDNHCPPGDALISLGEDLPHIGPGSSVVGLTILNALLVEAITQTREAGHQPSIFRSAGMEGAVDHNSRLLDGFNQRIPHI